MFAWDIMFYEETSVTFHIFEYLQGYVKSGATAKKMKRIVSISPE